MVGRSNLGLADALRRRVVDGDLRYVGVRHEGAASFAASAYGKLTGQAAACLTIAGPGATNLLTGLWDAKVDRAPVLALTGQVQTQVFGPGAFQDIDLSSAFQAVARFSQTVLATSRHAELMSLACKTALVERPRPCLMLRPGFARPTPSSPWTWATTPYSFGRYFESQGQRVLMSGYLGSIGFSLPAAIGAWAANQGALLSRHQALGHQLGPDRYRRNDAGLRSWPSAARRAGRAGAPCCQQPQRRLSETA